MFDPNKTVAVMNLKTLIVLDKDMILHYLNKFGFAEIRDDS